MTKLPDINTLLVVDKAGEGGRKAGTGEGRRTGEDVAQGRGMRGGGGRREEADDGDGDSSTDDTRSMVMSSSPAMSSTSMRASEVGE